MKRMVVQFLPTGEVQHTLKDSFFNPAPGAHRSVERLSEILFSEYFQGFYVDWRLGPMAGLHLTSQSWLQTFGYEQPAPMGLLSWFNSTMYFDSYEDAVAAEISIVEKLRASGVSFS